MTDSTPASSTPAHSTPAASTLAQLRSDALAILRATLADCSIPAAFARCLRVEGRTIHRLCGTSGPSALALDSFSQLFVVSLGKAAVPMLDALLAILPAEIPLRGLCAAPSLPTRQHAGITYFAAGHPLPNADSFAAARAALHLLHTADASTLVLFLISGGGSALCELPLDPTIPLEDTRRFHQALIGCGAPIADLNAMRQSFSAVKGGRLAAAAGPATQLSLLISDVPENALEALASGPTLPAQPSHEQLAHLLDHYRLWPQLPTAVGRFFQQTLANPAADPLLPDPSRCMHDLLLSDADLARAALHHAQSLGYATTVDNRCDDWDYAQAAEWLTDRLQQLRVNTPRTCLLSTGEVTVTLPAAPGTGGRNQQFALESARLLADSPSAPTVILSAGTDGVDGNSPAAGAIVDTATWSRAHALALDPDAALHSCNAWPLFQALGDTITTGPTGHNLRDLRLLLAAG